MPPVLPVLAFAALAALLLVVLRRCYDPLPAGPALLFAGLVLVLLGPALAAGRTVLPAGVLATEAPFRHLLARDERGNLLQSDLVRETFPAQVEVRRAVAAGEWPLLSARMGAGMPLLADPQAQVLQPLVWLAAPLPAIDAMAVTMALRLFVALAFTWLLLVRLGMAREAALFGAVSYGLGGFVVLWLGWPLANSAALLPPLLYAVERVTSRGGRRDVLLLAAALAAVLAAGHPETMLHVLLAGAAFGAARVLAVEGRARRLRTVAFAAAAGLLALALAAPVLLPAARYLPQAQRSATVEQARAHVQAGPWFGNEWSADVRDTGFSPLRARTAAQVAPNTFGNHRFRHYWGPNNVNADAAGFAGTLAMAGALAALLALLPGAGGRRRPGEAVMLGMAAVSLAVALRLPGVPRLLFSLPVLDRSVTLHGRVRLLVSFALAFLAAAALDRWLRGELRGRWLALAGAAAAGLSLWGTLAHPAPAGPPQELAWLRQWSLGVQLGAVAVAAAAVLLARSAAGRRRAALAVGLAAAAELLFFHLPAWPPMPRAAAYAVTQEIAWLQEHQTSPDGHRVMGFDGAILPNTPAVYGLPSPGAGGPTKPAAYADLLAPLLEQPGFGGSDRFVVARSPLYDLLGVRYVVVPYGIRPPREWARRLRHTGGRIYERPGPLPPLWLPRRAETCIRPLTACVDRVASFEEEARVELPAPAAPAGLPSWTTLADGRLAWRAAGTETRLARYRYRGAAWRSALSDLPEPRLLASSLYQDGGWHLLVDRRPRPTFAANGPFVAAFLPPGEHRLDLVHRPPGFLAGVLAAALGLAGVSLLLPPPPRLRRAAATSRSSPSGSPSSPAAR